MIDQPGPGEVTLTGREGQTQPAAEPAVGQMVVYSDGRELRTLPLNIPVITVGRTPANVLPLPHEAVSRAHAELRVSDDTVILTDVGSANGTFVNDVRLAPQQPVLLTPGSVVRIGPFLLRYEVPAAAAEAGVAELDQPPAAQPPQLASPLPPSVFVPPSAPRETYSASPPTRHMGTYLDFLPAIFQNSDFLSRFLLIFQSIWEPLEQRQDHIPMYFDPHTAPAPFLAWLGEWFGVDVELLSDEDRLRTLLGEAAELHRLRGTRYGLTRWIEICTGVTPLIAESASNPAVLHIRVALPPEANVDRSAIERLVRAHKPAHVAYLLEVFE